MDLVSAMIANTARPNQLAGMATDVQRNELAERKIRKAASDFEALLLSKWWSAMKQSGLPGTDDETDPGHDTLDALGMQAMSAAVTSGRGIGLGSILVHYLLSNVHGADSKTAETAAQPASHGQSGI
jgi:Rod binding domain-containing protein